MLREIKSKQLKNRLTYYQLTSTSTPSVSAGIGVGDLSTLTRTGGLTSSGLLRRPARQNLVYIASQINNSGGFVSDEGGVTVSTPAYKILNNAASTTDGTANVLCIGPDSTTIDSLPGINVTCCIDRSRIIWGKIASAGTVSIGKSDFSVVATATGVYTITYLKAFKRTALPFVTPIGAAYRGVKITNQSATGCTVTISDATPTDQNNDFYIMAIGTDSREETSRLKNLILNSQRKPRIEGLQFTVSGGAETITVGSKLYSLANQAAGDNILTLSTPYAREFASFALSGPGASKVQAVVSTANSASATRIQTYSVAGALTDPSGSSAVHVITIGSMVNEEF